MAGRTGAYRNRRLGTTRQDGEMGEKTQQEGSQGIGTAWGQIQRVIG